MAETRKTEIVSKAETARKAKITRDTRETQIQMSLNLDGTGKSSLDLKVGFLEHMLTLLAKHSAMDINLKAEATYTSISTTLQRTRESFWEKPFERLWEIKREFAATVFSSFRWTRLSSRSP